MSMRLSDAAVTRPGIHLPVDSWLRIYRLESVIGKQSLFSDFEFAVVPGKKVSKCDRIWYRSSNCYGDFPVLWGVLL